MSETPERDAHSGMETTGHEWDGIKELDSPLPRWWLWTFYVSVIWALGYWIAMPAWPLVSSFTSGVLGYTERARVADDIAAFNDQVDQMVMISGYRSPPMEIPKPDMSKKVYGKPLISSAWPWTKGSRSLIARKTYGKQAKNGADKG